MIYEVQLLCVVGKTLQEESKTLSGLGLKQDSKLIMLGRKASGAGKLCPDCYTV